MRLGFFTPRPRSSVFCVHVTGIPGLPTYEETDLLGFEPKSSAYHWYSVTNVARRTITIWTSAKMVNAPRTCRDFCRRRVSECDANRAAQLREISAWGAPRCQHSNRDVLRVRVRRERLVPLRAEVQNTCIGVGCEAAATDRCTARSGPDSDRI